MTTNNIDKAMLSTSDKLAHPSKPKATAPNEKNPEADAFQKFVLKSGAMVELNKKIYLTAEAWQFIVNLKKLNIDYEIMENGSEVVATCILKDNEDRVVSRGTMIASFDEEWLKDKPKYAVYGLAQTRAMSRAVRNKYAYIAKACGYEATPYDEMPKN